MMDGMQNARQGRILVVLVALVVGGASFVMTCSRSPRSIPAGPAAPAANGAASARNAATTQTAPVKPDPSKTVPFETYEIVGTYPHDKQCFSQGLVLDGTRLIESQGQYGESSLRLVELTTGKVLKKHELKPDFFAEGVTIFKELVYQLTWKERTCFVYRLADLEPAGTIRYDYEGWGLTHDGTHLIVSDGTDMLRFVSPTDLKTVRTLAVRDRGYPLRQLNELEFVRGEIWANVWHTEFLYKIDPKTGVVTGIVDLNGILPRAEHPDPESVLNGIAWDKATDRLFVTGKRWPKLFEIRTKKKD